MVIGWVIGAVILMSLLAFIINKVGQIGFLGIIVLIIFLKMKES